MALILKGSGGAGINELFGGCIDETSITRTNELKGVRASD